MQWIFETLESILADLNARVDARWGTGLTGDYNESEADRIERQTYEAQARYYARQAGTSSKKGMVVDRDPNYCNGLRRHKP